MFSGIAPTPFLQELFHFHGDFGKNLKNPCFLLKITQNKPLFRNPASSPAQVEFRVGKNTCFMCTAQPSGFHCENLDFTRVILGFTGFTG